MMNLLLIGFAGFAYSLRFELAATSGQGTIRCFEQYVLADAVVKGDIDIPNKAHQQVDFTIIDNTPIKNKHYTKLNVQGPQKFSFTTHVASIIKFCFTSTLNEGQQPGADMKRLVFLHVATEHKFVAIDHQSKSRYQAMEDEGQFLISIAGDAVGKLRQYRSADEEIFDISAMIKARIFNSSFLTIIILMLFGGVEIWYSGIN